MADDIYDLRLKKPGPDPESDEMAVALTAHTLGRVYDNLAFHDVQRVGERSVRFTVRIREGSPSPADHKEIESVAMSDWSPGDSRE